MSTCDYSVLVFKIIFRSLPLLMALWTISDIGLDINQSIIYYNNALENGTYAKWAEEHKEQTGDDYLETVTSAYFIVACVCWVHIHTGVHICTLYILCDCLPSLLDHE